VTTDRQMKQTIPSRENSEIQSFHYERKADARELRHALVLTIVAATAFALTALIGAGTASAMQLNAAAEKSPRVLFYAQPTPERFGFVREEEAAYGGDIDHELNDAWMGMSVISADGVNVGYVTDAFVNPDGSIDEIVIAPSGEAKGPSQPVYVPTRYAELGAQVVQVTLDARTIAQLEPATDLAMIGE